MFSEADHANGITTIDTKLNSLCYGYARMDACLRACFSCLRNATMSQLIEKGQMISAQMKEFLDMMYPMDA